MAMRMGRAARPSPPPARASIVGPWRRPRRLIGRRSRSTYTDRRVAARGCDVDWRAHQRWVQVGGRPMNVIDIGHRRSRACCGHDRLDPRADRARGRTGWRTSRTSPRTHRVHRDGPAGLRARRRCPPRRSRSAATRRRSTSCWERWASTRRDGRGQLDGRLRRRRAGDPLRHLGREARAGQRRGADDRAPAQRARAGAAATGVAAAGAGDRLAGVEVRRAGAPPAVAPGDAQHRRRASGPAAGAAGGRAAARRWEAGLHRRARRADRLLRSATGSARSRRRRWSSGATRTCSCRCATPWRVRAS